MANDKTMPDVEHTEVDAQGDDNASRIVSLWSWVRTPFLRFLIVGLILFAAVFASARLLERNPDYPIRTPLVFRGAGVLEGWVRFDGGWYAHIATSGCSERGAPESCGYNYTPGAQSSVAFFPAYPMSMRLLGFVTGDVILAGVVLTALAGLGTAIAMYRWSLRQGSEATATTATLLLICFPYAWYLYGAVYADAFFLCFSLAAFLLVERNRPILAGLVAAIATATRPTGLALVAGLIAVHLELRGVLCIPYLDRVRQIGWRQARLKRRQHHLAIPPDQRRQPQSELGDNDHGAIQVRLRRLRVRDAGLLLSVVGFLTWSGYLWLAWGSPFIFSEIEGVPGWDQAQGPHTWLKLDWISRFRLVPDQLANMGVTSQANAFYYTLGLTFQAALAIAVVALVPMVVRRVRWSYGFYTLIVVLVPIFGTKDWQGTGRYLLAAFPVAAALSAWLNAKGLERVRVALIGASVVILVFLSSAYARGYYLA